MYIFRSCCYAHPSKTRHIHSSLRRVSWDRGVAFGGMINQVEKNKFWTLSIEHHGTAIFQVKNTRITTNVVFLLLLCFSFGHGVTV